MNFITLTDYILLPVFLLIIFMSAIYTRNRNYAVGHPFRRYYLPALIVKMAGALGIGLVYQYYYGIGGDTAVYFQNAKLVANVFDRSISDFLELVCLPISSSETVREQVPWFNPDFGYNESNFFPIRILAPILLLTLNTYLPAACLIAYLSFLGIWKLFKAFAHINPSLHQEFALAFLFVPSVFFWGSGILKDTIVLCSLSWLFYSCYRLFILRVRMLSSAIILVSAALTITVVKPYVALVFFPSLIFWIFFQYRHQIRSYSLRVASFPFIIVLVTISSYFVFQEIGNQNRKYAAENLLEQAITFNANNKEAGSSIDLGVSNDSKPIELIYLAPLAVVTTLFRPFLFEANNPLMILSALEGTVLLSLFLYIIFKVGPVQSIKVVAGNPLLAFCLIFSILFAVGIGISTSNFGTIVRYKIPCIPFFIAALIILRSYAKITSQGNLVE